MDPEDLIRCKSILIALMAWLRQTIRYLSHYLNQCWTRSTNQPIWNHLPSMSLKLKRWISYIDESRVETWIWRPLVDMVIQNRWSFTTGVVNMFFVKNEPEKIWNWACRVSLDVFHCLWHSALSVRVISNNQVFKTLLSIMNNPSGYSITIISSSGQHNVVSNRNLAGYSSYDV